MRRSNPETVDVIIVGGGMVGATLACALAQQTALSIALLESQAQSPVWDENNYHHRVSAIALASKRIFESLNIWPLIQEKRVSPFTKIQVWDGVKPAEIVFDSHEIAEPVLGYIIENNVIQKALEEKIDSYPQIKRIAPVKLIDARETEDCIQLISDTDQIYQARLAIAADGAKSWLRAKMNIPIDKNEYAQEGIVATVQTALPHEKIARQVFLDTGPLAFLPLREENLSSIVWSMPTEEAQRLLNLDTESFQKELAKAFSYRLGIIEKIDRRFSFPLAKQQARQYVKSRLALVGDAAHTVHPLAGQGVNMGLLDAASLTEIIVDAVQKRRDFASYSTLRAYERWRRADNLNMLAGVEVIKKLFASDNHSLQLLRSCGLTLTNKMHRIKNIFARHAVGNRAGLPKLAMR